MAAVPSSMATATSTALVPSHTALQHQVLNLALARLRGCLEAPSGRARSFCKELGIGHYDLAKAVCRQQRWEGQGDHLDKPQAGVVAPKSREDIAAVPSDGLVALLAQDLSAAFFSQEVLHGERALGDARDRLEALWDKLIELTEERDKALQHVHLTPEKLNIVTALARALEQQAREEGGHAPFASAEIDLLRDEQRCRKAASASNPGGDVDPSRRTPARDVQPPPEATWGSPVGGVSPEAASPTGANSSPITKLIGRSSLIRPPSAGTAGAHSPPTSRLPPPKAGRKPCSLPTTPTGARHQRDRDDIASPMLPPPQRRRLHSPPQGQSTCERCGGGVGFRGGIFGRMGLAGPVVAERDVGERRSFTAFSGERGAVAADDERNELDRLKKEIEGLRGQRDALARSLSFARGQYSDALGDKPVQIERLSREVDTLRHTSETLRGELADEKKRRVEETSRLESRAAATREAADKEASRRVKEAERANTVVDPDHAAASEVLEKRALALEARSRSMASKNGSLQGRLDAALGEMEEALQANNALRAEADARHCSEQARRTQEANLLENISAERDGLADDLRDARIQLSSLQEDALSLRQVERATAADADALRALLAEARRDVEGAKATAAAAAAAAAVAAEATAAAGASAAGAAQDVETHKAARAAAEEEAQVESEAAASAAAAAVEAAEEAHEIFEEALAAAKATAEREAAAASQRASQAMDARDVKLRKLGEDVARLIDERDRMAEAIQEKVVEAERMLDVSAQQMAVAEAAAAGAAQEAENHKAAKAAVEEEAHAAREAAAAASAAAEKANDRFEEALAATKSTAKQEMAVASQRASQAMDMREVELRKLGEDMARLIDERDRMAEAMRKSAIETENILEHYAQQVTVADAAAAEAAREVGKHKAARAGAAETLEACEAAATASAAATLVAAEEANDRFEETLAATKATAKREMAAVSQRASQAMDMREVELRKVRENMARLVGERDGLAEAMKERVIEAERTLEFSGQQAVTAAEEQDAWVARSGEWENEAARLADALKAAEEDAAAARQDLEGARARARQELAEANEALALEGRLREEEAATARGREEVLENELEVTQALVLTLESEVSTPARYAETTVARATTDMAYMRDALGKAQARLGKMETERDAALRSLLAVAQGRGASRPPGFQERREEGDPCDGEHFDGSTEGGGGNDGNGSGSSGSGSARANVASNNAREDATEAFGGDGEDRGSDPAGEVTIDGTPSVEEDSKPAIGGAPYALFNERAGKIDGAARGGGGNGGEHACRVCGTTASSSPKLFECRLSLGRARADAAEARARAVESAERAAVAAEDAMASRRERKDLAATLEESVREVEAMRVESRRVSQLAMEREAGASHEVEIISVRLAGAEAQIMETTAELARERETKASAPTDNTTAELETIQAALDDCRADLNERTRQLYAVQDKAEAYSQAVATREAAQASASAKSLAKAMRETDTARGAGEELLRRAKDDAEAIREEEGRTAAAALAETVAAAEKFRARDAMDLAAVAREKDVLREKCVWLEARLSEIQAAKLASDTLVRRMEDATDDRDETVRTLERDTARQGEKMESLLAETRQALEQRIQEMEGAVAAAEAELDSERRRAASLEEAAAYELEQTIAAHQAELRGQAKAWATESRVADRDEVAAVVAAATATASARRELAQAVEAVSVREGEIATLQARLRSAEEEVEAARRKALLEGHAALLSDVAAANKKAAEARAEAAALLQRCDHQELAIGEMASSREEEADACRVARASLVKERLALAKAQGHVRELKIEVGRLSATTSARFPPQEGSGGESSDIVRPDGRGRTSDRSDNSPLTNNTEDSRSESTVARGRTGARETRERDRTRGVVLALEESLNAAREEAERLKNRVSWLRGGLHESEQRADEMEAVAASARAAADTVNTAMKATTAEAEIATARRHEAEQKALAVKRREEERNAAFEAEVSQVTSALREAQEGAAVARGEVSRLRGALRESDRRTAVLQESLAFSNSSLRTADAERARALIELVWRQDRGAEGGGGRVHCPSSRPSGEGVRAMVGTGGIADLSNERGLPPPPPLDSEEDQSVPTASTSILAIDTHHELTTLRHRLAASQAQHRELVRASDDAIVTCNQRCDARVRAVAAAGTLASACCRRRGIATGRESAVEAAARLALVKRCFRALREEALSRSRDRSVRRQDRIQRWIADAVERAGEEIILKNKRTSDGRGRIKVGSPPESADL